MARWYYLKNALLKKKNKPTLKQNLFCYQTFWQRYIEDTASVEQELRLQQSEEAFFRETSR